MFPELGDREGDVARLGQELGPSAEGGGQPACGNRMANKHSIYPHALPTLSISFEVAH